MHDEWNVKSPPQTRTVRGIRWSFEILQFPSCIMIFITWSRVPSIPPACCCWGLPFRTVCINLRLPVGKSRYRFVILLLAFQHLLQEPLVVFQCEITFLLDIDEAEDLADWIRMEFGVLLEILVKRLSEIETIDRPIFQLIAWFEDLLEFFDVPEMTGSYPTELREAHGVVKLILAGSFSIFVKEKCVEDIFRRKFFEDVQWDMIDLSWRAISRDAWARCSRRFLFEWINDHKVGERIHLFLGNFRSLVDFLHFTETVFRIDILQKFSKALIDSRE